MSFDSSADELIYIHPSRLHKSVFRTRARLQLERVWACLDSGCDHSICFASPCMHRCLLEDDLDLWAHDVADGMAMVTQPPACLLERWSREDDSDSIEALVPQSESISMVDQTSYVDSAYWDDCGDSDSICSYDFAPGIGYTTGSAIKGLGNLIIGGVARIDAKYRKTHLRLVLKLLRRAGASERNKALHRMVRWLIAPGRQLNGLFDDIIEIMSRNNSIVYTTTGDADSPLWSLACTLDTVRAPVPLFSLMKWLFIASEARSSRSLPATYELHRLFLCDFDNEEQALVAAADIFKCARKLTVFDNDALDWMTCRAPQWKIKRTHQLAQLLLTMHSDIQEKPEEIRQRSWTSLWQAGSIPINTCDPDEDPPTILKDLTTIHLSDENMVSDAAPSSSHSLWNGACDSLRLWMRQHPNANVWSGDKYTDEVFVGRIVYMMASAHPARRPALRDLDILVPVLRAVPSETWEKAAWTEFLQLYLPSLYREAHAASRVGEFLKDRALALAREF